MNETTKGDVCFNPRSRTGSDLIDDVIMVSGWEFQSTLPHGERL